MQKYLSYWLAAVLLAFSLMGSSAFAQDAPDEHYVTFRILAEKNTVTAGEEIWIGVEQSIAPEWHTYWQNPGDSGSAPRNDWRMPEGFTIEEIQWPAPHKIPYEPLLNYGYSENVLLLQKLKAPQELPAGPLKFSVDTEALVCKDICVPEYGTFEIILNDPNITEEDNSAYFEQTMAQWPVAQDWEAEFSSINGNLVLSIEAAPEFLAGIEQSSLQFIPSDWGIVENAAPAETAYQDNIIVISQKLGERPIEEIETLFGLLTYEDKGGNFRAISFKAQSLAAAAINAQAAPTGIINSEKTRTASTGFLTALIMAVLGGLVLNLMPCVFPVLSLKALSLVKIADKDHGLARLHGVAYTLGVILSFLAIATILIALQSGGAQIGWGFQLQNPIIISLLAYLLFVIGLNLSGFFDISGRFGNVGNDLARKEGLTGSFFTGILATIVATPCTAPFMGIAIGYALLQPAHVSLSIFAALGFGLALPYLLLAFIPALQKRLPKPGAWMETFRQFLAFPMFGFAAWLVWILAQQSGPFGVFGILLGMICIAFALWLLKLLPAAGGRRKTLIALAILFGLASLAFLPGKDAPLQPSLSAHAFGETFSQEKLASALASDRPVFVEMTAAWCITCKVNHATSINIQSTKKVFADRNVQYLIGDWTNQDPVITEYLDAFGRNGVPIYVYYAPPSAVNGVRPEPAVLPQILTPGIIAEAVSGT